MTIKIKGYSTLPPVEKVREKIAKGGKLNGPEALMAEAIREVETFLAGSPAKLHRAWVLGKEKMNQAEIRSLSHRISQIAFSIIVGQVWFSDLPTMDDTTVTIEVTGKAIVCEFEMKEIEIKL